MLDIGYWSTGAEDGWIEGRARHSVRAAVSS